MQLFPLRLRIRVINEAHAAVNGNDAARRIVGFSEKHSRFTDFPELSNFNLAPIEIDGKTWPANEHYYQAMKYPSDPDYQEKIRTTKKPQDAKRLGGARNKPLRKDWDLVKEDVMLKALRAKFSQNLSLNELLLSTGERSLHEHTKNDLYWGDGGAKKNGKDRLGILMMQVRKELRDTV